MSTTFHPLKAISSEFGVLGGLGKKMGGFAKKMSGFGRKSILSSKDWSVSGREFCCALFRILFQCQKQSYSSISIVSFLLSRVQICCSRLAA
jgi:hypothetical protein